MIKPIDERKFCTYIFNRLLLEKEIYMYIYIYICIQTDIIYKYIYIYNLNIILKAFLQLSNLY